MWLFGILFIAQTIPGLTLFPLPESPFVMRLGFVFVLLGLGLAVTARHQLATNWANAWEYQIKEKHELVTHGVYSVIRHPIYTGIVVAVIGAELVAQSYLLFLFFSFFWEHISKRKKKTRYWNRILGKHIGSIKNERKRSFLFSSKILWYTLRTSL